jgi:hypothetical protein
MKHKVLKKPMNKLLKGIILLDLIITLEITYFINSSSKFAL